MNWLQKLIRSWMSPSLAQAMEAESRAWMLRCPCGFERSIWELGGIRYKATGGARTLKRCTACRRIRWHKTVRKRAEDRRPASG